MTVNSHEITLYQVPVSAVEVGERMHFFEEDRAKSIADSIEAIGLKTPIQLRLIHGHRPVLHTLCGPRLRLVAGRHRLAAVRMLGWEMIPALVSEMTDDEAECAEIEENLQRGNLTVMEHAASLAGLKAIYLRTHPETARGGDRKSDQRDNNVPLPTTGAEALGKGVRFTKAEAEKRGLNEKAVKRLVQIGEAITSELRAEIGGTPLADNQAQLLKLVAQPRSERLQIVRLMKEHSKVKVLDGVRLMKGVDPSAPPPASDKEIWLRKMTALWATAPKAWRKEWLRDLKDGETI
ncbi:ParB N-terminal domain-containing protein [Rhodobacter capsulatus]|uniref:ParB N-terminal domain-containing protein n=1 Tax=Rhodobacter capsulatus TaxID=1061 RepID=UPI0040274E24